MDNGRQFKCHRAGRPRVQGKESCISDDAQLVEGIEQIK
jgi:hypothetical protein